MNARQKCKKLKKRNTLLMNIVNANPDFLRVFDYWTNKPLKIVNQQVRLQTYAATYPIDSIYGNEAREIAEEHIVYELSNAMRNNIEWKVENNDPRHMKLEGKIMIGEKETVIE